MKEVYDWEWDLSFIYSCQNKLKHRVRSVKFLESNNYQSMLDCNEKKEYQYAED